MSPMEHTFARATLHWFGDAQGQGARTFRGVDLDTFRAVRQQAAVREAEAQLNTVALTGNVEDTMAACDALTRVYQRALRQMREAVAA
jgi:hypothetical protein